ncbi:acyltransferase [Leptobacterium flavescens]|uniref:Acyltransferase n=1 Tax=Leptobacterium flavescens TaxID=472055 RepID=A0A6P0ULH2_9FLAO|nr:1-acyl-sn-glycerol-3-phosphate acyltransferase [Leptobacterium flavescens]NER11903.1 acyltransferase [Leptobacterium flavescens]
MRRLSKFIFFRLMGWTFNGDFEDIRKCVIIVVPHTSWHDFYVGVFVRSIAGLKINFVAKKELFRPPFGWYFRWMGGAPLDRTSGQNKVQAIAAIFDQKEEFRLALAPEGTRKKVEEWKTGFYYIAQEAKVPIIMVAFDFGKKQIKISQPVYPSGDIDTDIKDMKLFYKGAVGKVPEYT